MQHGATSDVWAASIHDYSDSATMAELWDKVRQIVSTATEVQKTHRPEIGSKGRWQRMRARKTPVGPDG